MSDAAIAAAQDTHKEHTMNTRSRAARLAGVVLAALTAAPLVGASTAAADSYPTGERINPAALPAGPATPLLRVVGQTIVDGDTRIPVSAAHVTMVGRSGADYLVLTGDSNYENWELRRVTGDGTATRVTGGASYQPDLRLADGGAHVVTSTYTRDDRTVLRVVDTSTGEVVKRRLFGRGVQPLDFGQRRMVLSQWGRRPAAQRTFWWNPFSDGTAKIADKPGYIADIETNRVGVFLGDPYLGGCQKVMTLTRPHTRLWRSCDDIALAFSPDGKRLLSTYILNDGPGPNMLQVRTTGGRVLDTYRARWFGAFKWESGNKLLLQAGSAKTVAMTRCTLKGCERISRLYRTNGRDPWSVMPPWSFADEFLGQR